MKQFVALLCVCSLLYSSFTFGADYGQPNLDVAPFAADSPTRTVNLSWDGPQGPIKISFIVNPSGVSETFVNNVPVDLTAEINDLKDLINSDRYTRLLQNPTDQNKQTLLKEVEPKILVISDKLSKVTGDQPDIKQVQDYAVHGIMKLFSTMTNIGRGIRQMTYYGPVYVEAALVLLNLYNLVFHGYYLSNGSFGEKIIDTLYVGVYWALVDATRGLMTLPKGWLWQHQFSILKPWKEQVNLLPKSLVGIIQKGHALCVKKMNLTKDAS